MVREDVDVVVLGAGLAGMTAAYELRQRRVIVLEQLDRVGGRTFSGGNDDTWYNLGAQIVTSPRLLALCAELGLDTVSLAEAEFAIGVNGHYARGKTPERLFMNMPISLRDKADFARTVLRLRRLLRRLDTMSQEQKLLLDSKSLSQVMGRVSPTTAQILNGFCEAATGAPANEVSALMGLAYGLGAYIDPHASKVNMAVRGGTQRITQRIAQLLAADSVRLSSTVTRVRQEGDAVVVDYTASEGTATSIRAKHVVCALPASVALDVLADLPEDVRRVMQERTPYSSLVSVAWPVKDGVPAPWDGLFFVPVSGRTAFSLATHFAYLGKLEHPELGGHIVTIANAHKANACRTASDAAVVQSFFMDLVELFPGAESVVSPAGAIVQRWDPVGLPWMRPGTFANRASLRRPFSGVLLAGDYTAEPGLAGANNSGYYVGKQVAEALGATSVSAV